ncbi:MAG: hypothetical protein EAZ09_08750 [Oscillatoriales cyanobacterium]|nr:MAG: hypothetical protein EAZ18_07715 [Oscillatoriales cyanobacterium]TAH23103.1 MAG: hypothetical protein EAZ09_08750 [Oscillatoriales cyanobacterium]
MGDRLFRDFAPLIFATHLKYYLLTLYHIHGYLSISAIDCSWTFDTKHNLPSHYFTRRMQQSFLDLPSIGAAIQLFKRVSEVYN